MVGTSCKKKKLASIGRDGSIPRFFPVMKDLRPSVFPGWIGGCPGSFQFDPRAGRMLN